MRAALITGRHRLELLDFGEPTPAPDGIVVDIILCGICGTDVHAFQSGNPYTPAICGHEWTGVVSAVGSQVRSVGESDRVVVAAPPPCGVCAPCDRGHGDHCREVFRTVIGKDASAPPHGGFAPRLAVSQHRVVRVDDRLSDEQAALVEPATIAFHGVRRSTLRAGDTAVIQGCGPIGLGTLQWVRGVGAGTIVAVEPDDHRRRVATDLGADHAVTPDDAAALVADLTNGVGADVVYECVGQPAAVQSAVDLARRGGSACLLGFTDEAASITPGSWLAKEITVTTAMAYLRSEFGVVMGMIADGRIDVLALHTATVGLDDLPSTIVDLASGSSDHLKVLVDPNR